SSLPYCFQRSAAHRDLPSFPTRRSSDLLLFTALLSIVIPRSGSYATLRADSRSGADTRPRQRARRILVATQVALTLVMLTGAGRSEEHTSELQSLTNLVCRLLLEKKKIH